jgi:hypothetical protein
VVQSDTLAGKIAQVIEYNMAFVDAQTTYFWWYEGLRLDTDGPLHLRWPAPAAKLAKRACECVLRDPGSTRGEGRGLYLRLH